MAATVDPEFEQIWSEVSKLGLERHVAELETRGYTVVEPELVAPIEFAEELRDAIIATHELRTGIPVGDLSTATVEHAAAAHRDYLLLEDRAFEQALCAPAAVALTHYLLGVRARLSLQIGFVKSRSDTTTHLLHCDNHGIPAPFPAYAQTANVTWVLSEYTRENGALAVVPGSHRLCRHPEPYEEDFINGNPGHEVVPVECEFGSLIVWHGNLWHGAYPRLNDGLRINLITYLARSYLQPVHDYRDRVSTEMLDRNPPVFSQLLGLENPYPYASAPNPNHMRTLLASGRTQWA